MFFSYTNERGKLKKIFCLAVLLIGFLVFCAPMVEAHANPIGIEDPELGYWEWSLKDGEEGSAQFFSLHVKTALRNGNVGEVIRLDLLPLYRKLASGTAPNDSFAWTFENAPLYVDEPDKTLAESNFKYFTSSFVEDAGLIADCIGESPLGLYDLNKLRHTSETREMKDSNGNVFYRCALLSISVEEWRSPYGKVCSREEALEYYNKCRRQIQVLVSKIKAARQSNGKPLTNEQKLKWIHDWLANTVEYDGEGMYLYCEGKAYDEYAHLWNEYGPIIEGRAVCEGYACAFKVIVDELVRQTGAKIECEIVCSGDHAWNRVKLNGKWYHVDVTYDDDGEDGFYKNVSTTYFLVSDSALLKEHPGGEEGYYTRFPVKAKDRKYEGKKWPQYKKSLSEYTVELKNPDEACIYNGKNVVPKVIVKYGQNILPSGAYTVKRTDKNKAGMGNIKIVPSSKCRALKGSVTGPKFKIIDGRISGSAKSKEQYKLGTSKSVRPFNKEFQPFASIYEYTKKPASAKNFSESLTLKKGTDYTVSYKNNKKPGWATATIKFKGKYTGKVTVKYKITK